MLQTWEGSTLRISPDLKGKRAGYVWDLAHAQVRAGADVLDVNVGVPGLDDVVLMPETVRLVAEMVDVPLCLDAPNSPALEAGLVTLRIIVRVRTQLGTNINLGACNVLHGLPDRPLVNQAFLALAMGAGATCAITDPAKSTRMIYAVDLLLGKGESAARNIK